MQSETTVGFIASFEDTGGITKMLQHPEEFNALASVRAALEQAGVEFTNSDEPGVKLRKDEV